MVFFQKLCFLKKHQFVTFLWCENTEKSNNSIAERIELVLKNTAVYYRLKLIDEIPGQICRSNYFNFEFEGLANILTKLHFNNLTG